MVAVRTAQGLVEGLAGLAHALDSLDLEVARGVEPAVVSTRDRLSRTVRSYLIPRVETPDIPLCVVLAGPTGSGKSTLANSLSGMDLSRTGPIRPTTKGPVVLTSGHASHHFELLAGLECEMVIGTSPVLNQLALVDTPDIDSTSTEHRGMAEALIDSADVVVFVTSALRYADEVPWTILRRAVARGAPVVHVLNRLSADSSGALVDLKSRLAEAGLDDEVMRIPEHHLEPGSQSIPSLSVKNLSRRLIGLARDKEAYRREVFGRVMDSTIEQVADLAGVVEEGRRWVDELKVNLRGEFANAVSHLELSGWGRVVDLAEPLPNGSRRTKRWLRSSRLEDGELDQLLLATRQRLTAAIEDDLGALTLRSGDLAIQLAGLGAPLTPAAMRRGIESVVSDWFEFVKRTVSDVESRNRDLAAAMVVEQALGTGSERAAAAVLGDAYRVLARRARRELEGRLESLYQAAANRAIAQLDPVLDDPHAGTALRRRAELVARFYFSDA